MCVSVDDEADLGDAVRALGLGRQDGCIVVVGGAGEMSGDEIARAETAFMDGLIPLVERRGVPVIDGGTDAGVMRATGRARARAGATFPLVGVVVGALVRSANCGRGARLEPNHRHFVIVPGADWGDEAPWLSRVAAAIAPTSRSVTILVNGGDVAWVDVELSLQEDRPVVIIEGTGRAADELAAALRGDSSDSRAVAIAATWSARMKSKSA